MDLVGGVDSVDKVERTLFVSSYGELIRDPWFVFGQQVVYQAPDLVQVELGGGVRV